MDLAEAARTEAPMVLLQLGSSQDGLAAEEAGRRLALVGPNAVRSHGASALAVLVRQVRNPLLVLLLGGAGISLVVGQHADAVIILLIVALSVGLGFLNEFRSEKAVEALHGTVRHYAIVVRDGHETSTDVVDLVPGDIVLVSTGDVVPADLRLLDVNGLACDESVLTGESLPDEKAVCPANGSDSPLDLPSCAFQGTVVQSGTGRGVVVRTGSRTAFGQIATGLGQRHAETAFQEGLRAFSRLLVGVATALSGGILLINLLRGRPLLDALLFSLAIAIGITPQLLPAIVTVSLSTGARRLAARKVIVKRLVSIEDLGNIDVLFTDKTGTLTEGSITYVGAMGVGDVPSADVLRDGLLCNEATFEERQAVGGNALDRALWASPEAQALTPALAAYRRLATAPFDYERRLVSVLVEDGGGRQTVVTKGAPESVLAACTVVPPGAREVLDARFAAAERIVAVAIRSTADRSTVTPDDERNLVLVGFLRFADPPKRDAAESIGRLAKLGVEVKVVTGDNPLVARKVCDDIGLAVHGALTGADVAAMSDDELRRAVLETTVFARVGPDQKSRIVRARRAKNIDVAFLGDGVNDAVALHDADVGISVDSAADVAKDAADIVLLEPDLGVLADGVVEGRRIFANTIKYILMGTSSNFGNMVSAAAASLFLRFLPMLPTQILLNNLLYDTSQLTIPTDNVDEELLWRPAHWDVSFVRRFMAFFGPISSAFDLITFAVMLWILDAGPREFRSGWFVESLATQTLVIFVIRTRRVPFFRSRPSRPMLVATISCALVGAVLPFSPIAHLLGFTHLPLSFELILVLMVATYLALAEAGKAKFFAPRRGDSPLTARRQPDVRRLHRLASRWSHPDKVAVPGRSRA